MIHNDRIQSQQAEKEKRPAKGEKSGTRSGRVVVEIKNPPRRGRAASMAAEKREAEREAVLADATAAEPEQTKDTAQLEAPEGA